MQKFVKKLNGDIEDFDISKLETSLKNSGASTDVLKKVASKVYDGIGENETTSQIYRKAYDMLEQMEQVSAMKYSLRRSLFALGPTGFPFEKFVANLFYKLGYDVQTNLMLEGKCVEHEIDVCLTGKENVIMEVKFHNKFAIRTDLKVALYVHSRFRDVVDISTVEGQKIQKGILITNTKFTSNAIKYAECSNLNLIGWAYPHKNNLQDLIKQVGMHPITSLCSLKPSEAKTLFAKNIITCRDLIENAENINGSILSKPRFDVLLNQAKSICT